MSEGNLPMWCPHIQWNCSYAQKNAKGGWEVSSPLTIQSSIFRFAPNYDAWSFCPWCGCPKPEFGQ